MPENRDARPETLVSKPQMSRPVEEGVAAVVESALVRLRMKRMRKKRLRAKVCKGWTLQERKFVFILNCCVLGVCSDLSENDLRRP